MEKFLASTEIIFAFSFCIFSKSFASMNSGKFLKKSLVNSSNLPGSNPSLENNPLILENHSVHLGKLDHDQTEEQTPGLGVGPLHPFDFVRQDLALLGGHDVRFVDVEEGEG